MVWIVLIVVLIFVIFLAYMSPLDSNNSSRTVTIDISRHTYKETYEVKGVHFDDRNNYIIRFCEPRHPVTIIHEKENKFSDLALQIMHQGVCIGYIAEGDNYDVFDLIQKDHTALLNSIDFFDNYLDVYVDIYY